MCSVDLSKYVSTIPRRSSQDFHPPLHLRDIQKFALITSSLPTAYTSRIPGSYLDYSSELQYPRKTEDSSMSNAYINL
jgi:hypothetical protein